jgi:hypothetical protein
MQFATQVRRHAQFILSSTVLAIDPASGGSSMPGWACFKKGVLVRSGTLAIMGANIQERLRCLYDTIVEAEPDVLVIERIRGVRAHEHLHWSVGVSIAASAPLILLEMPVSTWKKFAGPEHKKSDEADAVAIGETLIAMAGGKYP